MANFYFMLSFTAAGVCMNTVAAWVQRPPLRPRPWALWISIEVALVLINFALAGFWATRIMEEHPLREVLWR